MAPFLSPEVPEEEDEELEEELEVQERPRAKNPPPVSYVLQLQLTLSVDSLTYSFVICLCQLSYVTILCHRHSAQDIPVTTLAGDSVLWPSDPIVIVGYGVGPNRTPFSEAGRVLYCLLGRLGNVYCQVT